MTKEKVVAKKATKTELDRKTISANKDASQGGYVITQRFNLRSDRIIDTQTVPIYDIDAFAGIISAEVEDVEPEEFMKMEDLPPIEGVLHVKGNSMADLILNGDYAAFSIVPNRRGGLFFGEIYIIAFDDDGDQHVVIKYLQESEIEGHYKLISHNPDYAPKDIPRNSVRLLAIVKATARRYR